MLHRLFVAARTAAVQRGAMSISGGSSSSFSSGCSPSSEHRAWLTGQHPRHARSLGRGTCPALVVSSRSPSQLTAARASASSCFSPVTQQLCHVSSVPCTPLLGTRLAAPKPLGCFSTSPTTPASRSRAARWSRPVCSAAGQGNQRPGMPQDQQDQQQQQRSASGLSASELDKRLALLGTRISQELGIPAPLLSLSQHTRLTCPYCKGGSTGSDHNSFSISVVDEGSVALFNCFRATCGQAGRIDLAGKFDSRSKSSEIRHNLDDVWGQQMLKFFEERGISRDVVEACGVYSALVLPPSAAELAQGTGLVSSSTSTGTGTSTSTSAEGADGEVSGRRQGEARRVHCAVLPYRDSEGKEVSRTYMYLKAVEVEEARQGRMPVQLRSPPEYAGPQLGVPVLESKAQGSEQGMGGTEVTSRSSWQPGDGRQEGGEVQGAVMKQQPQQQRQRQPEAAGPWFERGLGQRHARAAVPDTWGSGVGPAGSRALSSSSQPAPSRGRSAAALEGGGTGARPGPDQLPAVGQPPSGTSKEASPVPQGRATAAGQPPPHPVPPAPKQHANAPRSLAAVVSGNQSFVDFFLEESARKEMEDVHRSRRNRDVAHQLALLKHAITLENVEQLKALKGIGDKSIRKMKDQLLARSPLPASEPPPEGMGALHSLHGPDSARPHPHEGMLPSAGEEQRPAPSKGRVGGASSRLSPSGTTSRGMSTSAAPPPNAAAEAGALGLHHLDAPDSAARSTSPPPSRGDIQAAVVAENKGLVDHFLHLAGQAAAEKRQGHADMFMKGAGRVASSPQAVTLDEAGMEQMEHLCMTAELKREAILYISRSGPNAALIREMSHKSTVHVLVSLARCPCMLDESNFPDMKIQGVGAQYRKRIMDALKRLGARACEPASPLPPALSAPQGPGAAAPQPHSRQDGDSAGDNEEGGHGAASSRSNGARSASRPDPVARMEAPPPAPLDLPPDEHPASAAAAAAAAVSGSWAADSMEAMEHLDAGLPSVWHTEAGSKRVLWGVHDVASFLAKEDAALASGQVLEEECVEGSGKGKAPLYLYLVEDELDRLSLVKLGLRPHAVLSLPPNIRRDFQQMCDQRQQWRRSAVMLPRTSDLLDGEHAQAGRRRGRGSWVEKDGGGGGRGHEKLSGERAVLNCITSVAESVFRQDKCTRVYLALRNGPLRPGGRDNGELEDSIASVLGKERCARIRWPTSLDNLPFSSPHSPENKAYLQPLPPPTSDDADAAEAPSASVFGSAQQLTDSSNGGATGTAPSPTFASISHGTSLGSATGPTLGHALHPLRLSANEVLVADGLHALLYVVQYQVTDWPVEGLHEMSDFTETILQDYHDRRGFSQGVSTGWPYLDQSYRVVPGELTLVVGVPNSGKSEWLDALCMNLAKQAGWTIAMCSFEKSPKSHACNLLEKYVEKPFMPSVQETDENGEIVELEQMSEEEVMEGMQFLDSHFLLIRHAMEDRVPIEEREPEWVMGAVDAPQDASPTIDWVLSKAVSAVKRYNIRGLVIDPYNELNQWGRNESETEFVSQMLSKIKRFAQHNSVHVWFVAHPRQLYDYSTSRPPTLYDVSGSAHFYNKADAGIVVHRPMNALSRNEGGPDPSLNPVHILVKKMRNKSAGKQGECVLLYKRSTGIYYEPDPELQEQWSL